MIINLSISIKGTEKRVVCSTGVHVPIKHWNKKTQRPKKDNADMIRAYKRLDEIENVLLTELETINTNTITSGRLKSILERERSKKEASSISVLEAYQKYYNAVSVDLKESSQRTFRMIKTRFKRIQDFIGRELFFEDFDDAMYYKLLDFHKQEGFAYNTTGSFFKKLKTFFKWAAKQGYHSTDAYKEYKSFATEADLTYLEEDELMVLLEHKCESPYKQVVLDKFCLMAVSGMRFSCVMDMVPEHVNLKGESIVKRIVKTSARNHVYPLNKYSIDILQRNWENPLFWKSMSSQKFSDSIKEVAKAAQLYRDLRLSVRIIGGERVYNVLLCDHISSHMAKRTFVTLSLMKGMDLSDVMKITGNRDYKSLMPYIKIAEQHSKKVMRNVWG